MDKEEGKNGYGNQSWEIMCEIKCGNEMKTRTKRVFFQAGL